MDDKCSILLVEDNKIDQMSFIKTIKVMGPSYSYRVAGSVSEAQEILNCEQFDVIIADYLLGDGTAFEVLDLVKNTPVVIVTGTGDEEIAVKAWKAGAYDYLIKDSDMNYLKTVAITINNAVKYKMSERKVELLSCAVTRSDDSVYISDLNEKILFVNKAFCETYGYDESQVLGMNCDILWKGHSGHHVDTVVECEAIGGWETGSYHKCKDDSEFPVSVYKSVIRDESKNEIGYLWVAKDISEHIFLENELRNINLELGPISH